MLNVRHTTVTWITFSLGTWMSKPLLNEPFALFSNKVQRGGARLMPAP